MVPSIKACLTAISWAGLSSAHLIMKSPVPFGVDTLNNSPLNNAAIGSASSDFPCKQRTGVYKISQMNSMPVGLAQTLSFSGSASHGGGTCQLAVSLDQEPTANSTWKLIQVYEGGCPTAGGGNGGTDDYSFKIPANFPNGQATLAWTWYNRVGNREIYMNCAPITVSGGVDNTDYYNTLPDMYIINLPTSNCASVESTNQAIPNPGQFVLKGDLTDKAADATGPGCAAAAAAQTQGVSGYQGPASGSNATVATTAAADTTAASPPNNGLYTQPTSAAATMLLTQTTQAAYTQPTSLAVQSTQAVYTSTAAAETTTVPATSPSATTTLPLSLMITVPSISPPAETEEATQPPVSYSAPSTVQTSPVQPSAISTSPVSTQSAPAASMPPAYANATALPSNPLITTGTVSAAATPPAGTMSSPDAITSAVSTPTTTALATGMSSTMDGEEPSSTTYSATTPSAGTASGTTCPQDGALLCNGPTQFGLCDHGHVVWQAVAAGTTCSNGAITKRALVGVKFGRKEQLGRWFVKAP